MRRYHLIFGAAAFLLFLVTGQLMRADFPDKETLDESLRVLMRSRHIYLLFSALLHILTGIYFQRSGSRAVTVLQFAGSLTLTAATILLSVAFFYETYSAGIFTGISAAGLYLSLAGVILHLPAAFGLGKKKAESEDSASRQSN